MSDTPNLGLPLLAASQAQKHVTMNDALLRLDALSSMVVKSRSEPSPPLTVSDGQVYLVPDGAGEAWAGRAGQLAFFVNGGWSFALPKTGWQTWIEDEARRITFAGDRWISDLIGPFAQGACSSMRIESCDFELVEDNINVTDVMIPSHSVVHCVTARVIEDITGPDLFTWRLGVFGSVRRYGSQIGIAKNSTCIGLSSSPLAYYEDTVLRLAPDAGLISGGVVRLAVHYSQFQPPDAV